MSPSLRVAATSLMLLCTASVYVVDGAYSRGCYAGSAVGSVESSAVFGSYCATPGNIQENLCSDTCGYTKTNPPVGDPNATNGTALLKCNGVHTCTVPAPSQAVACDAVGPTP